MLHMVLHLSDPASIPLLNLFRLYIFLLLLSEISLIVHGLSALLELLLERSKFGLFEIIAFAQSSYLVLVEFVLGFEFFVGVGGADVGLGNLRLFLQFFL
jgi:hypothetical protein